MFRRNNPAMPSLKEWPYVPHNGLTKFEQCAKEFTAVALPIAVYRHGLIDNGKEAVREAVKLGILAAEEFCHQMEEREK